MTLPYGAHRVPQHSAVWVWAEWLTKDPAGNVSDWNEEYQFTTTDARTSTVTARDLTATRLRMNIGMLRSAIRSSSERWSDFDAVCDAGDGIAAALAGGVSLSGYTALYQAVIAAPLAHRLADEVEMCRIHEMGGATAAA